MQWETYAFIETFKRVAWIMKVNRLEGKMIECRKMLYSYSKMMTCFHIDLEILFFQISHHDWWVPIYFLTRWNRVTNALYSSSFWDESNPTCFMNLKKEGFGPKKGPSLFNFSECKEGKPMSFHVCRV